MGGRRQIVGLVLCGAAVVALTVALVTRTWWTHQINRDATIEVGLLSGEACVGTYSSKYLSGPQLPVVPEGRSACASQRLADLTRRLEANWDRFIMGEVWGPASRPESDRAFALLGQLTLALGGIAALFLATAGIAVAAGSRRRIWRTTALVGSVASGGVLATTLGFVLIAPASIAQLSLGLGFTCALTGAGFGIAAGQVLAGDDGGEADEPPLAHTPQRWRVVTVLAVGIVTATAALHSRTWWTDDNPNLIARHGVRDVQTCWKQEKLCEVETWYSPPVWAGGARPLKERAAFRVSEAAYQLGHLAVFVSIALLILLVRGHLVRSPWAPHRVLVALALGFSLAAVALTFGAMPSGIDDSAHRSVGPVIALLGAGLLIWGGIATGRLGRPPGPRRQPLPRARVHQ